MPEKPFQDVSRSETWRPILDGNIAARATDVLRQFADHLQDPSAIGEQGAGIAGGYSGLALFYAYLVRSGHGHGHDHRAIEYLEQAARVVAETRMAPTLYSGFIGIAWTAEHLRGWYLDPEEDSNESIDDTLLETLKARPRELRWGYDYDLISGLTGLGVYAIERLPRPVAVECLELIVDRLDASAEHGPHGITWWTPPEMVLSDDRTQYPSGYYNVGVAHGVPGIIAFLAHACGAGVAVDRARPLLDGAVAWLLTQKLPDDAGSRFPSHAGPGIQPTLARLGWCYGDLGIAVALLHAALAVGERNWEREAIHTALEAAKRPPGASAGVSDAGLCHGATGIGHLFNRLFQATGEAKLKDAAREWLIHALEMRRPGHGIVGYAALRKDRDGNGYWVDDRGFLTGVAGIGLGLLAAVTPLEPTWDRVLLASLPIHVR